MSDIISTDDFENGSANDSKNIAVEYMNEKYDDTFYYSDKLGGQFDTDVSEYLLTSEKFPDTGIWVAVGSGDYRADNYVNIKYEAQVNELIDDILSEVFPGAAYCFDKDLNTPRICVEGSSNDMTFEEFISQESAGLKLSAYVDISEMSFDKDEIQEKVINTAVSKGICLSFCDIWFFNDYDSNIATDSDVRDDLIINEKYDYYFVAEMSDNQSASSAEWEK